MKPNGAQKRRIARIREAQKWLEAYGRKLNWTRLQEITYQNAVRALENLAKTERAA